jgi:hypothetical protein
MVSLGSGRSRDVFLGLAGALRVLPCDLVPNAPSDSATEFSAVASPHGTPESSPDDRAHGKPNREVLSVSALAGAV